MELFKSYLIDFDENANEADGQINALSSLTGDALRYKENEIESVLAECNQIISSMTVAIPNVTNKQQAQDTIDKCKARFKDLQKRFKTIREVAKGKNDRLALLGGTDADSLASVQARTAVLSDTDALRRGEDELSQINRRVNDIGAQGVETLDVMAGQRERMEGQRSRLDGIRMKIRDSERLIRAIGARMSVNDFMKLGIMIVLIILIAVIIYLRWIRRIVKVVPPAAPVMPVPAVPEPIVPVVPSTDGNDQRVLSTTLWI